MRPWPKDVIPLVGGTEENSLQFPISRCPGTPRIYTAIYRYTNPLGSSDGQQLEHFKYVTTLADTCTSHKMSQRCTLVSLISKLSLLPGDIQ